MPLYSVFRSILKGEADFSFVVNRDAVNQGVPQDLIELCNNACNETYLKTKFAILFRIVSSASI